MQHYLVDIYKAAETTVNGEPMDSTTILHADVPASKLRLSGNTRYMAAGAGVTLSMRLGIPYYSDVDERCLVDNVRTREGGTLEEQPPRYRVTFVERGERRHHLELDLEALRDESGT